MTGVNIDEHITRGMERARLFLLLAVIGFVLMIAGFAGYVIEPWLLYEVLFIAGLAVMLGSYAMLMLSDRKQGERVEELREREAVDGYVYYLSGEPSENGATITDLTRRR